ncbi:13594_t:CDS:2 [Acaulospora morrowiae]|uniref:13594_t:CDS:1 n=1 Tax=Acaulospora morrowiae TaxID=94023 RepID=A0A9N9E280_9GLOM|nr:13594_t:CDS:2 [Acaulospora morrowiae]
MGVKCGKQKYIDDDENMLDIPLKQNTPLKSKKSLVGKCRDCRKPNTDKYQKAGWFKSIDNSANMAGEFFHEIRTYLQSGAENRSMVRIYGITQDPQTQDYMIVSEYANHGNLRSFLVQNHRALNWERRLRILLKIAMALQDLHQAGFVHKDFHSGNILQIDEYIKISDFGLCQIPNGDARKIQKSPGSKGHRQTVDPAVLKIHPEAHYTSRPFNYIDLKQSNFVNRTRHDSAFGSATRLLSTNNSNKDGRYHMANQREDESNYVPLPQVDLEKLRTPSMAISGPIYTELLRKHYRSDKIFYDESQNGYTGKESYMVVDLLKYEIKGEFVIYKTTDNDSESSQTISPAISDVASTRYSEILSAELVRRISPGIERHASRYSLALVAEIQRRSTPKLPEAHVTAQPQLSEEKFIEYPEKQKDKCSVKTNETRKIRRDSISSSDYNGFNKFKKYNSYQNRRAEIVQEYVNSTNKYHDQTAEGMQGENADELEIFDSDDNDMLQYICKQPTVLKARRMKIASYPNTFVTRFEHTPPTPTLPLVNDNTN